MRNIAHMKKFVEPATTKIEASKGPEQPELPEQVVELAQSDQPETKVIQSSVEPQEVLPSNSPCSADRSFCLQIVHLKKKKRKNIFPLEAALLLMLILEVFISVRGRCGVPETEVESVLYMMGKTVKKRKIVRQE